MTAETVGRVQVQHVNVKIFAEDTESVDLAGAIPVFHRWIQESICEELLIDVADYRHVPAGPGVLLVGHEANYSLDLSGWRLGLLYNRKAVAANNPRENLTQAFRAALTACQRLEREPEFRGNLKFNAGECDVILNDRLLAPNTEATWQALKVDFETFFRSLYGTGYRLDRPDEPRERFRVCVKATGAVDALALVEASGRGSRRER
jgi:hypothetical protein